ncbi:MAG TPA: GerAB/ArcD/ProY family transporter [Limnochordia bacterium]
MDGLTRTPSDITRYQVFALTAGSIIGVGVLVLPRWIVERAGSGAALAMGIGSLLALGLAWLWSKAMEQYPTVGPRAVARTAGVGHAARVVLAVALGGFYLVAAAMVAREFGEVVVSAILTQTPLEVTVLLLLGLSAYMVRQSIQAQMRVFELLLPLMVFPGVLIAFFSLQNARALNLLPVWGNHPSGLWSASLIALGSFEGMMVSAMVVTIPGRPRRLVGPMLWAVVVSLFVYILVTTATLAVFGPQETRELMWPTLELARITSLPGNILERIEALFLAVWVAAVFTTLAGALLTVAVIAARVMRLANHREVVPWLLPILYVIAMVPRNIQALYAFLILWVEIGLVVFVLIPVCMWVVGWASPIRRRAPGRSAAAGSGGEGG